MISLSRSRGLLALATVALLAATTATAKAASVVFTGTSGSLKAEATFNLTGTTLTVTLKNTSNVDPGAPANLLTAVLWDSSVNIGGTYSNIALAPGSTLIGSGAGTATNAGYFGYSTNASATGGITQKYAASSAGLGIDYGASNANTRNLLNDGTHGSPNGPTGGLSGTSTPADPSAQQPQINNGVVFTISGVSTNFAALTSLDNVINNVRFQYGTGLTEPTFGGTPTPGPVVPVPAAIWAGGSMLAALGVRRFWKKA